MGEKLSLSSHYMSSNQNHWQGSEQIGITSREFYWPKPRVVWLSQNVPVAESGEKQAVFTVG